MATHICPRRAENPSIPGLPEEDTWDNRGYSACSYCGSMNPDQFMEHLEHGDVTVTPTDKSYKVYVEGEGLTGAKFYFQHLSQEQQARFIELHNSGRLNLNYPGYFYVRPFFCGAAA